MAERSETLQGQSQDDRAALERRLLDRQSGRCFICDEAIDLMLHKDQLDIDHIIPLADHGPDDEQNFALTHASAGVHA